MREYPMRAKDIISQESIDAGRVYLAYYYNDIVEMVNKAFFSGFIVGISDSKETFDSFTPDDRAKACLLAVHNLAIFQGRPSPLDEPIQQEITE